MGSALSGDLKSPLGPYKSVGRITFKFDSTPLCKMFFPITSIPGANAAAQEPYTRTEVVEGMARAVGGNVSLLKRTMGRTKHSFATEGVLANATLQLPKDMPLVLFSHGLFGTSDHYSKVCGDFASLGAVVIAFEHEDGSGSYANVNGKPLYYESPGGAAYTRENVLRFRGKQLAKREEELRAVLDIVLGVNDVDLTELQEQVLANVDRSRIFLAGHSFGGASTCATAFKFEQEEFLQERIQGYICLDLWSMPLPEALLETGLRKPLISIRSRNFAFNSEAAYIERLLSASPNCKLNVYMEGIIHEQFSDVPWYVNMKTFVLPICAKRLCILRLCFRYSSSRLLRRIARLEGRTRREKSQAAIVAAASAFLEDPNEFHKGIISGTKDGKRLKHIPSSQPSSPHNV